MTETIATSLADGVLCITLARANKRNALDDHMYGLLAKALQRAISEPAVRAVLLDAEGVDFCAGNDIADFLHFAATGKSLTEAAVVGMIEALAQLDKPLVAAVQGRAVGIGFTMLLHCDALCLSENAELSAPFVRLGVVPEAASSLLLPSRIGHVRAYELFALGKPVRAAEALQLGLASRVVAAEQLASVSLQLARSLAQLPPEAVRATKRLLRDSALLTRVMRTEQQVFDERFRSAEAQAVFAAFAKR